MYQADEIPVAHPDLRCWEVFGRYWLFAAGHFRPSWWLIMNREGFSGNLIDDSDELDELLQSFDTHDLIRIHELHEPAPTLGYDPFDVILEGEVQAHILAGFIQVFDINEEEVRNLGQSGHPIYSNSLDAPDPLTESRYQLGHTLGLDVAARWRTKDGLDSMHWQRGLFMRELYEAYDVGEQAVNTAVDLVVGLWELGKAVIHIAEEGISLVVDISLAVNNFKRQLLRGDVNGIRRDLEALGIAVGDTLDSAEKFGATLKAGAYMVRSLLADPFTRELLADYASSIYESVPYRKSRVWGVRIAFEIGLEVLIALATAGVGNVVRGASRVGRLADTVSDTAGVAVKGKRIGPFPAEAMDELADLAKRLDEVELRHKEQQALDNLGPNPNKGVIVPRPERPVDGISIKSKPEPEALDNKKEFEGDNPNERKELDNARSDENTVDLDSVSVEAVKGTSFDAEGKLFNDTSLPLLNQGQKNTCGPNSCGMVLDTLMPNRNVTNLGGLIGADVRVVRINELADNLNANGLDATFNRRLDLGTLRSVTSGKNPAIVAIQTPQGGHAVVVDGFTKKLGRDVVSIRNPWGEAYFQTVDEFKKVYLNQGVVIK